MLATASAAYAGKEVVEQETVELLNAGVPLGTSTDTDTTDQFIVSPPVPKLTRYTKVPEKNLIPLQLDAFEFKRDGVTPRSNKVNSSAGRTALGRAVHRLNLALIVQH